MKKKLDKDSKLDPNATPEEAAIARAQDDADGRYWSPEAKGELISGRIEKIETLPARKGYAKRDVIHLQTEAGIKLIGVSVVIARKIADLAKSKNPAVPPVKAGVGLVVVYNGLAGGAKKGEKVKGKHPAKLFGLSTFK